MNESSETATARLTFGRFAGKPLTDVPADYLLWLADNAESETLRNLAQQQLGLEPADLGPDPSPEAASVVLPGVIFEWITTMQRKHAGRPLALAVVRDGSEVLKTICTRYTRKQWLTDIETRTAKPASDTTAKPATPTRSEDGCGKCGGNEQRLRWKTIAGGNRVIRAECANCNAYIRFARQTPANVAEADRNPSHDEYPAPPALFGGGA
ncbi:MAG: DUF3820 family protein [Planctomycetes bacterium]|nr:DUF3820 family protein [Planctomycetota bacterium]